MNLCVIPARGGSKRLPGKNMRPFFGYAVIHYAIQTARLAKVFDRIMVSSDNDYTLAYARGLEVETHKRSEWASRDEATDYDVIREVLKTENPDYLCYLYPVTPLLSPERLVQAYESLTGAPAEVVCGVGEAGQHLAPRGNRYAGCFYWIKTVEFRLMSEDAYYESMVPFPLGRFEHLDVNTEEDWQMMEALFAWKNR